ncbi:hypothetical protein JCM10212_006340, partial [Sporobolomyces blumeae]
MHPNGTYYYPYPRPAVPPPVPAVELPTSLPRPASTTNVSTPSDRTSLQPIFSIRSGSTSSVNLAAPPTIEAHSRLEFVPPPVPAPRSGYPPLVNGTITSASYPPPPPPPPKRPYDPLFPSVLAPYPPPPGPPRAPPPPLLDPNSRSTTTSSYSPLDSDRSFRRGQEQQPDRPLVSSTQYDPFRPAPVFTFRSLERVDHEFRTGPLVPSYPPPSSTQFHLGTSTAPPFKASTSSTFPSTLPPPHLLISPFSSSSSVPTTSSSFASTNLDSSALPAAPLPPTATSSSSASSNSSIPPSTVPFSFSSLSCDAARGHRGSSPPCEAQVSDLYLLESVEKGWFKMATEYADALRDLSTMTVDKLKSTMKRLNDSLGSGLRISGLKNDL